MNVLFLREMDVVPELVNLHPVMLIPSKVAPKISDWVRVSDTNVITANNWLRDRRGVVTC